MIDPDTETHMDHYAVLDGYISITPIHYRLTNHEFLDELSSWNFL
jgi:broad specificity polyphosphatase/5'/3'-nucleotidase SurE